MSASKKIEVDENDERHEDPSKGLTPLEDLVRRAETIEFMHIMLQRMKVEKGFRSVQMANAPNDYYSWDLAKRAKFLGAPSAQSLCKTMIMVNYEYRESNASDPHYPRYLVVVIQYCRQISSQKVLNFAKKYQNSFYNDKANESKKVGIKGFKFRMATQEDMSRLSGYKHNAVTPFFMANEDLVVVLDEHIT